MLGSTARRMLGFALAAFRSVGAVALIGLLGALTACWDGTSTVQAVSTTQQLVSISLSPPDASLAAGLTQHLTATGIYSDGSKRNISSSVAWTSSRTAIATISGNGTAMGLSSGSTTITASAGSISGTTTLTVTAVQLVSIGVTPAAPRIALGTIQALKAIGMYSDNSIHDVTDTVSWESATPTVAAVDNAGQAIGSSVGETLITATLGGVTSPGVTLKVTGATLVSITVTPAIATLANGTQQQFTATGTYSDRSTQDLSSSTTWSSSAPAVATLGSNGLANATGVGITSITAALSGVTATLGAVSSAPVALNVTPATLVSIGVTPGAPSIALGTSEQFTATGIYTDNSTQDLTTAAAWVSSSASVASIGNAAGSNGLAVSLSAGSTTITAVVGSVTSGPVMLTVTAATLVSIAITPAAPSIALGTQQQLTATGSFADNSTQDVTTQVAWVSDDAGVASISNASGTQGLASSVATGAANISATLGAVSAAPITLTVTLVPLVSIYLVNPLASVLLGDSVQYRAEGIYADSSVQDVTTLVTWASSDTTVATISNAAGSNSVVTPLTTGTTIISATLGNVSLSIPLTVFP